jgi:glycosyltransferase involved in cell wall biosynthesis
MTGTGSIRYVVITPVRNEVDHLANTISSMAAQSIRPTRWIIVDDGSSDGTGKIADEATRQYDWIRVVHRPDRGFRKSGGGVMEAFYDGMALVDISDWHFLVKLDGDLSFDPDYFEGCFRRFDKDAKLGIGGGIICSRQPEGLVSEYDNDPPFHVRGATKIYRRECWDKLGGLVRQPGWDTVDELKALMLGWNTYSFSECKLVHHKHTGHADGAWMNWVKNGFANYVTGYHPVFMVLKCARRLFEKPYVICGTGLLVGFIRGYWRRAPQVPDPALIQFLRREQMNRLLRRKSIWG